MPLAIGQHAPDFSAQTWDGRTLHLAETLQRGKVWLAFFRYASCPLCNLRINDIIKRHDALHAQGVQVLAVFQSPPARVTEYVGKQAPPFPLLCDPTEALYGLYQLSTSLAGFLHPKGVVVAFQAARLGFLPGHMDGSKTRIPGDFLISPDGTLSDVFYGDTIADHIPFARVEAFAQA